MVRHASAKVHHFDFPSSQEGDDKAQRSSNSRVSVSLSSERCLAAELGGGLRGRRGFGVCTTVVCPRGQLC